MVCQEYSDNAIQNYLAETKKSSSIEELPLIVSFN